MKKTIILTMLLTAGGLSANGQIQFSFGPGGGANFAVHSSSWMKESESRLAPLITSQVDMQFSRSLAVLVWIDFYNNMSIPQHSANYFSIAPTIKYCVLRSPFYLFAGPGVGIKIGDNTSQDYYGYYADDIPDTRVDLRLGAGYEFYLSRKFTLTPFAAFNVGLNEVDWRVQALQLGLVFRINISN